MHTDFSPAHERFRDEVRDFLSANLTPELRAAASACPGLFLDYDANMAWHKILYAQGWVAPAWPKEYGGPGWDLTQRSIWAEESALANAPQTAPMGLGMCGPVLIGHGSTEQRDYYLPRILSGEDYWCQGYSEPGSGSDLASLKLQALSDGDEFVLNGSKIWTTHAHFANRMFCLVRTNPNTKPQRGISFLLLEMNTPGVSVEPIRFASGTHEVNQVFFDNVRVPKSNLVGAENDGWSVAKYLLEFERGGGASAARSNATLEKLAQAADGVAQPSFRQQLNSANIQTLALEATERRIHAALSGGQNPGPESSIVKNLGANVTQRLTELGVDAVGYHLNPARLAAALPDAAPSAADQLSATAFLRYFNLRASSIAGGSNEVQKNIIAKLVLGL